MRAYFVILAFIILVSGCVNPFGGSSGGGGPGVVINSFSFSPSSLKSNQLTKLSLSIENKGDYAVDADAGIVYLFNLPNDWELTDKGDSTSNQETFGLIAPRVQGVKKYSGESKGFEWVLRAPLNLPKDELFSYIAQARVCYPYKTKIWGRLEVVSEDAWLQNPPSQHAIAAQQTQGPLKVEFISKQPLMVETDVRVKVRITNVGDGVVTTNDCAVFATVDSGEESDTINNLNHITLGDSDCTLADELYLKKGQTKETYITCTPPALGNNPITTSDFTMELIYNYYSDRKATISVTGTSEDASGGMVAGGGGATGVITLKDPCSSACKATGQTYETGIGICADAALSTVKYPGTSVDVAIEPLKPVTDLSGVLGSTYTTATIKTLKLHDALAKDLALETMTLGLLDTKAASTQYEKAKLYPKTAGTVGIIDYLCSGAIDNSMILTQDNKDKGTLCPTAIKSVPLSNLRAINAPVGNNFKDLLLTGLTITSIADRSISSMTGGNLSAINIEDFKVSSIASILAASPVTSDNQNYMRFASCSSGNVISGYSLSTVCQCVLGVSGARLNAFDGVANAECNTVCMDEKKKAATWAWIDGGVCNTAAVSGTKQCSGTITYDYRSRPATVACSGESGKTTCYCYDRVSISTTESALLCK